MTSLAATMRADARLTILRVLAEDPGYSTNHAILRIAVDRLSAITMSEDEVKRHLEWLENHGAVVTEAAAPYLLARLTDRGLALARGEANLDGVSRPRPDQMI